VIGQTLGEYEILHALKSGGMGDVLLARRRGPAGFEQVCAIKTVRAELSTTPLARTMFLDEARLLAQLTHPGIAQIFDFGEIDGVAYMVMEYVPGMSFRGLGDRRPPAPVLCQAVADACRGLHAAHELRDLVDGHLLGVVHRDISPDNLMLGYDARVKVLDFGIALVRGRQAPVTEYGTLKGKPPYMSPEQIKNLPLDRRSDVFSCAAVLWELITGQRLFGGDSIYAVARAVEHQVIVPPSQIVPGVPDGLDDVIMAGLERDPDRRLATAAAMAEVLERIAGASTRLSLEAWTERSLATEREAHRLWLAGVLGGDRRAVAMGRPSGVGTAIDAGRVERTAIDTGGATALDRPAPSVKAEVQDRPVALVDRAAVSDHHMVPIAGSSASRRIVVLAVVLIASLVAGGLWWRSRPSAGLGLAIDAGAIVADTDARTDADSGSPVDAASIDARGKVSVPPVDAHRVAVPDDARPAVDARAPSPIDAAGVAMAPAVDAAVAVVTGSLAIGAWSPAADVTVDGVDWHETPVMARKLPIGAHDVVLRNRLTHEVVYSRRIEIEAGHVTRIASP
jgi:eukaryotic-like serine/threonine-protein kinase